MAEIQYGDVGVVAPAGGANLTVLVNWLGALISITLMAGLVWWGYQLLVRDVSGVPVVRALEGPMRITPDDPGGLSALHQGLAVNNIAAVGEAEAPADRLVLAPKPTVLNGEDQTAEVLQQMQAEQLVTNVPVPDENALSSSAPVLSDSAEALEPVVADQASLIEATLRQVESSQITTPVLQEENAPQADAIAATIPGVSKSILPTLRPARTNVAVSSADASGASVDPVTSVAPSQIPAGTRLAQLGAYETVDVAKFEWTKISAKFEDFMAGKARVIEQAQSGGKVFYRLRAHGFDDLSDARRFCSALLAGQANCIPVVTR
ncbi:MAG: SPOR domain-containing protein [Paracoccaceae bacterium]